VLKDGAPFLVIGSPAGQRIPGAVLQCTLDCLDAHLPLEKIIESPRFHVRRPAAIADPANDLDLEAEAPKSLDADLEAKGWKVYRRSRSEFYFGAVNAAQFLPNGEILGVADQRRTGDAGGE
jgi:gamma-glutamyltranspeptidase/glutathione hydrolase